MIKKFYKTLFDSGEGICWSRDPKGTTVYPAWHSEHFADVHYTEFFCINPLNLFEDTRPTSNWHSKSVPRRADCNVTSYRNILIEIDELSLEEQLARLKESKLPYSTLVYSGSKSYHIIISLETPCKNKAEYKQITEAIYETLIRDYNIPVDVSNSNPSRFSRFPGAHRKMEQHDDGNWYKVQSLKEVNGRVSDTMLYSWLGVPKEEVLASNFNNHLGAHIEYKGEAIKGKKLLYGSTKKFLEFGASDGTWNRTLFIAVCDMRRSGYERDEIIEACEKITGSLDNKDRATIDSAISNVDYDQVKGAL